MSVRRSKEYFDNLHLLSFPQFMDEFLDTYQEVGKMILKSHKAANGGARYSANLHYKIRQGTISLGKYGAVFRARTIEFDKRKLGSFNHV